MSEDFYQTDDSVEAYIKAAEGHSGQALIEQLKQVLPAPSKVLEIGSGPGTDWALLQQHYHVTGSDFSEAFLKRLQTKFPQGEFLSINAESLETNHMFDGIYSNKVLHHLTDQELEASIQRQHEILHPKGVVCHSFWRGEGSEIFKGLLVNYHSETGLTSFFEPYFELIAIQSYPEFEANDSLSLIARKK